MSDAPQADGWWQASDGKWYPPEAHPNYAPTPPPPPAPAPPTPASASPPPPLTPTPPATQPSAEPSSAAGKAWWKRWWAIALGGLVLLIVLAGIFAPSEEDGDEGAEQVVADAEPVEEADEADDGTEPEATEPPAATSEPQPTPTAEPTSTPQPTPTPEATATPEPTPTPEPPGFGGGVQMVGSDIARGIYATGEVGFCYWERLAGLSGELDDIIANDNAIETAQVLVDVAAGDVAFNSDGCGRWQLVDAIELPVRAAPADGDWLVGRQIEPGIYRTVGEPEFCY